MAGPWGYNLANNYSSGAPATQVPQIDVPPWRGGRGALVISATTYPTTVKLQYVGRAKAIDIVTVTADGVYVFDLPAGPYQLFMSGGAAAAVNADLVAIPQA